MMAVRQSKGVNNYVSVVVPAYNAETTLDETLASLKAQTLQSWEAIIVDDGSTDNTTAIARRWSGHDSRFRLVRQANGGESAARNTGIHEARYDWLAFLDSDDWLAPQYLELMMHQIAANPRLDAVVCGCERVTPSGQHGAPALYDPAYLFDAFPEFVRDCPLAIHNCMVRRSLVARIGEFDTSLVTCADWDFWQRVARVRPRFGTVPEVLAYYRIRPGSSSTHAERVLLDGFNVIRRGHAPDPRVANPYPAYADGLPRKELPEALYRHALWPASLRLGQGKDARSLLRFMGDARAPWLDPAQVAKNLFDFIPLAAAATTEDWLALWPRVEGRLRAYLSALETRSEAVGLAQRCIRHLERLIIEARDPEQPFILGVTYGVRIDINRPICDVLLPAGVEQLNCMVQAAGRYIGAVQLPVTGSRAAKAVIAEAIETELAWPLMQWYFRLDPPPGLSMRTKWYGLRQETKPLRIARQLATFTWPLVDWQWRTGLLREPQRLARLLWFMLNRRTLQLAFQLVHPSSKSRRERVEAFLGQMARRFVREADLVTTGSIHHQ